MASLSLNAPFYEIEQQIAIDLPGARAVFTTRRGGHSRPPYDTLNLGLLTADAPAAVRANRAWLEQRFGVKLAYGKQVHGTHVRSADAPNPDNSRSPDGDGIATATAGVGPLVLSADCLPVVIAAGGAVAAVHAGWKGLHGGVIAEGVEAVRALAASRPQSDHGTAHRHHDDHDPATVELHAAIGPAAGVCCYEVGDELHRRFADVPGYACRGRNLDLKSIARAQLRAAGVSTVHDVGICTICDSDGLLFSHRREHGVTGRQGALAWLT